MDGQACGVFLRNKLPTLSACYRVYYDPTSGDSPGVFDDQRSSLSLTRFALFASLICKQKITPFRRGYHELPVAKAYGFLKDKDFLSSVENVEHH